MKKKKTFRIKATRIAILNALFALLHFSYLVIENKVRNSSKNFC